MGNVMKWRDNQAVCDFADMYRVLLESKHEKCPNVVEFHVNSWLHSDHDKHHAIIETHEKEIVVAWIKRGGNSVISWQTLPIEFLQCFVDVGNDES